MKKIILIVSILSSTSFNFGQTGTPPAVATNPPSTQTTANFAWYRGGNNNTGPAGSNNIFGTRWLSDIFIMTNNRSIAQFTSGNSLTSIAGNSGDGLRIRNLTPAGSSGNLDLFTSHSSGQNETHIVFGGNGQISGQANRFEQYASGLGFWFNALGGRSIWNINGDENARMGINTYWRFGANVDDLDAARRIESIDGNQQLRLSNLNGAYAEFFAKTDSKLLIMPNGENTGFTNTLTYDPSERIDVDGNGRFRTLPNSVNQGSTAVNKVVMVDADGVLRWRDASLFGGVSTAINGAWVNPSNQVQWGTNPLIQNTDLPMSTFKVLFSTPTLSNNTFTIGGTIYQPSSRFYVDNDNLSAGATIRSYSLNSTFIPSRLGLGAFAYDAINLTGVFGFARNGTQVQGVYGFAQNGSGSTIGVRGFASSLNGNNLNYGADFVASGGSFFENDGVRGYADGSVKTNFGGKFKAGGSGTLSIGVYGEATTPVLGGPAYAGYFVGEVITTGGTLWASDSTLKENVSPISNASDSLLMSVQPMSFDYKQDGNAARLHLPEGTRFGILAQQIEPLFPSIVKTAIHPAEYDSLGLEIAPSFEYKVVDVSQLVPIMLSDLQKKTAIISNQSNQIAVLTNSVDSLSTAISDLNARLTLLENCLSNILPALCNANQMAVQQTSEEVQEQLRAAINVNLSDRNSIVLNQNVPNPFAESTIITFTIPATVQKAQIHFYDGQGKLINSVDIVERGNGQLNVFANDLSTGVYTYSLVADGQIVSTKRMMKQ